eukprot:CAMPEP_0198337772 /NCGR_PEP_ID=MMETSP1450-20131203/31166_1 /TAXON_ID=753684 ORGANISM="Madagascaria erythrocladiodes, Strain CCMP3234" /NCGR_SAMPLE_ID=MMETSP1450 /ASSEMBLY_ACC=CAM_ASM_001115 /LENGTH=203 /DNA_ID=CAMNT_0044042607 /DNA_START=132 /DNA_END=743 /DNA_ORIENTATION=+
MSDKNPAMKPVVPAAGMPWPLFFAFISGMYVAVAYVADYFDVNGRVLGVLAAARVAEGDAPAVAAGVALIAYYWSTVHGLYWVFSARERWRIGHPIAVPLPQDFRDKQRGERNECLCWMRGYENLVEWGPVYAMAQAYLLYGASAPGLSLAASTLWLVGRVLYTTGYARGGANGRFAGFTVWVMAIALGIGTAYLRVGRHFLK